MTKRFPTVNNSRKCWRVNILKKSKTNSERETSRAIHLSFSPYKTLGYYCQRSLAANHCPAVASILKTTKTFIAANSRVFCRDNSSIYKTTTCVFLKTVNSSFLKKANFRLHFCYPHRIRRRDNVATIASRLLLPSCNILPPKSLKFNPIVSELSRVEFSSRPGARNAK